MSKELKNQIEQDAKSNAASYGYFPGSEEDNDLQSAYVTGATTYAARAITLERENERLRKALEIVQKWQLPPTGRFWDKEEAQPMSYGACYGSNGERDYMMAIANSALSQTPKPTTNDTVNG